MLTLGTMMDAYIDHVRRTGKPTSISNARAAKRKLVNFFLARTPVQAIVENSGLERFQEAQLRRGLSRTTINTTVRYFRTAWQYAVDEKLPGAPPFLRAVKRVRDLRVDVKRPTALSAEELLTVLAAAPSTRCARVMAFAAYAGLRHTEILRLTAADVDLGARMIRVRGKVGWTPKNRHERDVPIGPSLLPYAEAAMAEGGEARDPETGQFWLFASRRHFGAALIGIDHEVRRAFAAAGIYPERKPGLHMLRRTFATRLAERGVPLPVIRDLMGHASVEVTERNYIAAMPKASWDACSSL